MSLKDLSLQNLIDMAMERVPADVDRRVGSIIYDTIASVAAPLLFMALEGAQIDQATYIESAYGEYLDLRVAEKALTRYPATKAIKRARFTRNDEPATNVPVDARFSAIDNDDGLTYVVLSQIEDTPGDYLVECEIVGTVGNLYYGALMPISYIDTLSSAAIIADYQEARDVESDDDLRQRYLDVYKRSSFGGNVSQYDEEVKKLDGVGEVQVYRAYPSSGHITISVVGPGYRKISADLIRTLQDTIDPTINNQQGTGLGIAPIFHKVHVTTPIEQSIPISFTLQVDNGYTVEQLRPLINEKIEEYFSQLRKEWGVLDTTTYTYNLTIYTTRIIVALLGITGIVNVSDIKINGAVGDYTLTETGQTQTLPILGTVVING